MRSDIALIDNMKDIDKIYDKLIAKQLFDKVYIIPEISVPYFERNILKYRKMEKFLDSNFNDNILKGKKIYIYNDWNAVGYYLNLKRIKYYLLEDGLDCYKKGGMIEQYYQKLDNPVYKIRRFVGYGVFFWGESPYMYSLEVNDKKGLCINNNKKIIEVPRKEMYSNLDADRKKMILDIFFDEKSELMELNKEQEVSILLTQPLYVDRVAKNEEIQIALYKNLIDEYGVGQVWIKPHPRDVINYSKVFPQCHVIPSQSVPVELFDFIPNFRCRRVITAYSTAINGINFCDDKIAFTREKTDKMCKIIEDKIESEKK